MRPGRGIGWAGRAGYACGWLWARWRLVWAARAVRALMWATIAAGAASLTLWLLGGTSPGFMAAVLGFAAVTNYAGGAWLERRGQR